jgi:tetratricopeptide (TPR) repeat protein
MSSDEAGSSPFLGVDRAKIVQGILEVYDRVRTTGESHWISIEAPSGWGKTRLVQEFYAELVKHCQSASDDPPYWPSRINETESRSGHDIEARRKQLFPEVWHVPGSLPTFGWWGIACSLRNGIPSVALAEDLAQFEGHAPYLDDAWHVATSEGLRRLPWKHSFRAAGQEAAMEVIGAALEAAVGTAVPGLGFAKWIGDQTVSSVRSSRERVQRSAASASIGRDHSALVDGLAGKLTKLGQAGIPTVIFVEDAQFADETLSEFLENLMRLKSSALIITTAWSGFAQQKEVLAGVFGHHSPGDDSYSQRKFRIQHDSESLPAPFPEAISLQSLLLSEREELVRFYFPDADDRTCRELAGKYENPLALELVCTMPRFLIKFPQGDLLLTSEEIADLPSTVKDLYRHIWKLLPDEIRKALSLATLGIPQLISPDLGRSVQWHDPSLAWAAKRLEPLADLSDTLLGDSATFSWAKQLSNRLSQFHESAQMGVASEDNRYYIDADVHPLLAQVVSALLVGDGLSTEPEINHAADTVIALHCRGVEVAPEALVLATTIQLELVSGYPKDVANLVQIAQFALGRSKHPSDRTRDLRHQLGTALLELDRSEEAAVLFEEVVAELEQAGRRFTSASFDARNNLACSYANCGGLEQAILVSEALIEDQGRFEGFDSTQVMSTRNNLAFFYGEIGQTDKAIALCEEVLAGQGRTQPEHASDTLSTQANLASLYSADGRVQQALAMGERVVFGREATLGPKHVHTLSARGNLAVFYNDADHSSKAIALSEALLKDREEIQGSNHPETLNERNLLATYYDSAGRVAEAIAYSRELVQDQILHLGPDHPDTLSTRFNLGCFLGRAGNTQEAIDIFSALLPDRERVLGAEHPGTISVFENLRYLSALDED